VKNVGLAGFIGRWTGFLVEWVGVCWRSRSFVTAVEHPGSVPLEFGCVKVLGVGGFVQVCWRSGFNVFDLFFEFLDVLVRLACGGCRV